MVRVFGAVVAVVGVIAVMGTDVVVLDLVADGIPDCFPHEERTVIKITNRRNFIGSLSM